MARKTARKTAPKKEAPIVEPDLEDEFEDDEDDLDPPTTKPSVEGDDVDEKSIEDEFIETMRQAYDAGGPPAAPADSPYARGQRFLGHLHGLNDLLGKGSYRRLADVVPGGELSDEVDAVIRETCQNLDRFMRSWANGRP